MKKLAAVAFLVGVLIVVGVTPSEAGGRRGWHRGSHVRSHVVLGFGFGPAFGWPAPYPYWYYPPYYAYTPPAVVVQPPPVYIEQQAAPATPAPTQGYWYYCPSAGAYYPTVPTCPEAWVQVPPRSE